MQHADRNRFITDVIAAARESYAGDGRAAGDDAAFARRVDAAIDAFLLESQPIVGAYTTILIADIRGFTALVRAYPIERMARLLNDWFAAMTEVIDAHGGVVDKFIGDAVMALFGAPQQRADDLERALGCAVAMQRRMLELNQRNEANGLPRLFAGIALNTGQVMAGSFGSREHSEYTVLGDPVNLVARIEAFSLRGQVLISETSREAAAGLIETGPPNEVLVKGMAAPLRLYELRSLLQPVRLEVPRVEARRSPRIRVDLAAVFRQLDYKCVQSDRIMGRINDLGYYGLRADLPLGLPNAAEVVINLPPQQGFGPMGDVYARVLRARPHGSTFSTTMELTSVDTPEHRRLKEIVDDSLWRR